MTGFLSGELIGFALCWRIERRDGVALGFTSHDRDLIVDGFRFRSAPGISPSAVEDGDPLQEASLEVSGALAGDAIRPDDLLAGRWDGAGVWLYAVDWADPTQRLQLTRGELGAVSLEQGRFAAEFKGPGASLDRMVAEETSPMCRAHLGDRRCSVDLAARRQIARVVAVSVTALQLDVPEPVVGAWSDGRLRWLDGDNAGLTSAVGSSEGASLVLADPPRFVVAPGTRVEVIEGCDKRFSTCRDRFDNAANFRGEPHLPGMDLLTRYPGE